MGQLRHAVELAQYRAMYSSSASFGILSCPPSQLR